MAATNEPDEVLQLRACRAEVDEIRKKLEAARKRQAQADEEVRELLAEEAKTLKKRRDAADAAKIPRLRIAQKSGLQRSYLYTFLDGNAGEDSKN